MSQFLTILVLDKDTVSAQKVLASDRTILVQVSSVAQFRHFIAHSCCNIWLCDLTTEGLDFAADAALVRNRNPNTRIVLTGPVFTSSTAAAIQEQGLASAFVVKPWNLLSLRQAILSPSGDGETEPPANMPSAEGISPAINRSSRTTGHIVTDADNTDNRKILGSTARIVQQSGYIDTRRLSGMTGRITLRTTNTDSRKSTGRITPYIGNTERVSSNKPTIRIVSNNSQSLRPRQQAQPVPSITLQEPRYRLEQQLGEGGIGKVYLAYDLLLETKVAIKILRQDFVRNEGVLQALKSEAKICMQLTHPHIVRFYDFGQRAGTYFLVMEYVQGQTLFEAMQVPESRDHGYIRNVLAAIGSALNYAHSHGVLHNDISPGNVLIGTDGMLKLIDFGIASVANQRREKAEFIFGTPAYMSPEQLRCDPSLDHTTDIFALGVLMHQLLTGMLPQREDATNEELATQPRPPITLLPSPIADVLNCALAFDPAHRWRSVSDMVTAFNDALD